MRSWSNEMRVGVVTLLVVWAVACGDDDIGGYADSGFSTRDAAFDAGCVLPYYLSAHDRNPDAGADDAGQSMDAGALSCESFLDAGVRNDGTPDSECPAILWTFAGGERIGVDGGGLEGCCIHGQCGGLDPTGVVGCIPRAVFGASDMTCTADPNIDAGDDNDSGPPAT